MYEDIEDNGGMRRYSHEKTLREDYGARRLCGFVVSFSSLLSHRNHRTVKWGPREPVRMTEVMLNQNLCLRVKTMRANLVQSRTSQLCL